MIGIEQFIKVIHAAVLSANDALMKENLKLLDNYFETSADVESMRQHIEEALDSMDDLLFHHRPTKEVIEQAREKFVAARNALQEEGEKEVVAKVPGSLQPKTVTLQYPEQSSEGSFMRNVEVPLITLIPVSMAQVSEVKFKTELELLIEDNNLKVSFPSAAASSANSKEEKSTSRSSSIEITITPQQSSEGLRLLIEGYEKALRSQIPN